MILDSRVGKFIPIHSNSYFFNRQKRKILVPVALAFVGFLSLHVGAFGCMAFQVKPNSLDDTPISTIGYWSVAYPARDGCFKYPKVEQEFADDQYFQAGRALGLIGAGLAWFVQGTMVAATARRVPAPQTFKRCLSASLFLMAAFSVLVLIGLGSQRLETFKIGVGAGVSIMGALFWILAGISVLYCIEERDLPQRPVLERSPSEIA